MDIERKLIILSGEGSGSIKITSVGSEHKIEVSLFSLPYKRYYLIIKEKDLFEYEWEGTHTSVLHKGALNCALAHFVISDGERVILYGTQNARRLWQSNLPIRRKSSEKINFSVAIPKTTTDFSFTEITAPNYDDGAVAQDNYYERRAIDGLEGSMAFSEEYKNYILSVSEMEKAEVKLPVVEDKLDTDERAEEIAFKIPPVEREESVVARGRKLTFFERVKENIDKLFAEGERVIELEDNMPFTKWVRVEFQRKFYLVGLVGNPPEYLCYGLPSRYSTPPPSELSEGAVWLPKDVRKPMEEGYWVLYQSLASGETVKNQ